MSDTKQQTTTDMRSDTKGSRFRASMIVHHNIQHSPPKVSGGIHRRNSRSPRPAERRWEATEATTGRRWGSRQPYSRPISPHHRIEPYRSETYSQQAFDLIASHSSSKRKRLTKTIL